MGSGVESRPPAPPPREYRLTFGVQYDRELHPRGPWVTPDGWVTIVAGSFAEARTIVVDLFGTAWSDLYDVLGTVRADLYDEYFQAELFPAGELLRIVVPTGLLEVEDHRV